MQKIAFSVIVPLYNKANHIQDTLMSIKNQYLQPSQVIVVDDGSSDDGVAKVKDFIRENSALNMILLQQPNQGVSVARNNGVKHAEYDYLAFIDADDLWQPFYLHCMAELINYYPKASLYASSYQYKFDEDTYTNPKIRGLKQTGEHFLIKDFFTIASNGDLPFNASSFAMKKSMFNRLNGFPEGEAMGEDQDLFCRAALQAPMAYTPKVLSLYFVTSDNRACEQYIPTEPCPFAIRLMEYNSVTTTTHAKAISKYCAAHICDLVQKNIAVRRYNAAKNLLKEAICLKKPWHYVYLTLQCNFKILVDRTAKANNAS